AQSKTLTQTTPLNRTTTLSLNSSDQIASIKLGSLTPLNISYDERAKITELNQSGRKLKISYDEWGRISELQDPYGRTRTLEYDAANRITKEILPDGKYISYTYDPNGNLLTLTPPEKETH